jgi:hypothetical protein
MTGIIHPSDTYQGVADEYLGTIREAYYLPYGQQLSLRRINVSW